MAPTPHPAYTNSSHIMCKYPFSGSLVLLLPLLHRFAPLVSFQTHSNLARTHTHTHTRRHIYTCARTHTHTHKHAQASLAAMSGTPDCPILTNMSGMKVTAWLGEREKKKKKHLPCCLRDQSWSCLVWECSVSENRPPCHPWCARRISDQVCWWRGIHRSFSGSLISGRRWQQTYVNQEAGQESTYLLIDCNS